jgi:hypothetical protein
VGLKKTKTSVRMASLDWDLNLESPAYEAGVLTTQPQCSGLTDILLIGIYSDVVTDHTADSLKMDLALIRLQTHIKLLSIILVSCIRKQQNSTIGNTLLRLVFLSHPPVYLHVTHNHFMGIEMALCTCCAAPQTVTPLPVYLHWSPNGCVSTACTILETPIQHSAN